MVDETGVPSLYFPGEIVDTLEQSGFPLLPPDDESLVTTKNGKQLWKEVVVVLGAKVYQKASKAGDLHTIVEVQHQIAPDTYSPKNLRPTAKKFTGFYRLNPPAMVKDPNSGQGQMTRIALRRIKQLAIAAGLLERGTKGGVDFLPFFTKGEDGAIPVVGKKAIVEVSLELSKSLDGEESASRNGDVERYFPIS